MDSPEAIRVNIIWDSGLQGKVIARLVFVFADVCSAGCAAGEPCLHQPRRGSETPTPAPCGGRWHRQGNGPNHPSQYRLSQGPRPPSRTSRAFRRSLGKLTSHPPQQRQVRRFLPPNFSLYAKHGKSKA
jgi:hypothetical protein